MRIAVSGTTKTGKSCYIEDFLDIWSDYKVPDKSYRDVVGDSELLREGATTKDVQQKILDHMCAEHKKYTPTSKVVFDRCPLDNLAYTIWAYDKGKVDEDFVGKTVEAVKEAMTLVDIIFFFPVSKTSPVDYKFTEEQAIFRSEVDNIFKQLYNQWMNNPKCGFFDPRDKPAIIEIFGTRQQRVTLTRMYLNDSGDPIDATPTLESLSEMSDMQRLAEEVGEAAKDEKQPKIF
ncbi:AAA family ATPase [bacterium]|nr:AAA family ATPase [bacterium]